MILENVIAVTGAKLVNTPSISRFNTIALKADRVKNGDLFVAKNPESVDEALKNGAYGIMTDKLVNPSDEEVAWIIVNDLKSALHKLLSLWLIMNPRDIFIVSKEVIEFLRQISYEQKMVLLENETIKKSEQILLSKKDQMIVCDNELFFKCIGIDTKTPKRKEIPFKVLSSTIFETSVKILDNYYPRLMLSVCMIDFFKHALEIMQAADIPYSLSHLTHTSSFEPIFVDHNLNPLPFGQSEHVLIFISPLVLKTSMQRFEDIGWIDRKLYLPTGYKPMCDITMPMQTFDSIHDLTQMLLHSHAVSYNIIVDTNSSIFFDEHNKELSYKSYFQKGLF